MVNLFGLHSKKCTELTDANLPQERFLLYFIHLLYQDLLLLLYYVEFICQNQINCMYLVTHIETSTTFF